MAAVYQEKDRSQRSGIAPRLEARATFVQCVRQPKSSVSLEAGFHVDECLCMAHLKKQVPL